MLGVLEFRSTATLNYVIIQNTENLHTMSFYNSCIRLFSLFVLITLNTSLFASTVDVIEVNVRVYLEGPMIGSFETGATHNRPLMRDDLRENPIDNNQYIPVSDIYQTPYSSNGYVEVDITDFYTAVGCGTFEYNKTIANPNQVFSVTGEDAIVDWVFVELRAENNMDQVIATRSGLLQRDGDVVDLDGVSPLTFEGIATANYFVAVRHRNHLGVMTLYPQTPEQLSDLVDFSDFNLALYDFGNNDPKFDYSGLAAKVQTDHNIRVLFGGDFNCDGKVIFVGESNDHTVIHEEVAMYDPSANPLYTTSFDGAIGYLQGDFDMNGQVKFTNPGDDSNYLYGQVILYSLNSLSYANFAHLVQQLP